MKRGKLKRSKSGGENGNSNQSHKLVSDGSTPSPAPIKRIAPFSFSVTEHAITRLRRGYVIRYDGLEHVVTKVNQSCARIAPLHTAGTETVKFTPRFSEKPVTFSVPIKHNVVSISANSEGEILRKLSPEQMESRGFK